MGCGIRYLSDDDAGDDLFAVSANSRNPHHFETIEGGKLEGGRKRAANTF